MLIAQISDSHIMAQGRKTLGIAPMSQNLAACVRYLNQLEPAPDVVLVTGDVSDQGDAAAMAEAATILDRLKCRYFAIPGNHDDAATFWAQFGDTACPSRTAAGIDYVIEGFALRLICMDSTRDGAPGGALSPAQLQWLDQRLRESPAQPTLLFMHHPPLDLGILETDMDGFVNRDHLGRIVRQHSNILRIACGHVHLAINARWNGTLVCTAPGTGMHLALDLTLLKPSRFLLGPPTCLLHHWSAQKRLITHTVTIESRDGPHLFVPPGEGAGR
jgi:3',5'-cyclic-AMP phosphodiesterase